ncbi:hypothetical protein L484_022638 [Morus notabilis]|uniref:Uncharacterized protein n=1 Tax=Morus notabilis TaxID=981085 RepID=W9R5P3_9ROSA|nr:hypothetical protein L484_022638 [Morus notabilis]
MKVVKTSLANQNRTRTRSRGEVGIPVHNFDLFFSLPVHLRFSLSDSQSNYGNIAIVYSPVRSHLLRRRPLEQSQIQAKIFHRHRDRRFQHDLIVLKLDLIIATHVSQRSANSDSCKHHRRIKRSSESVVDFLGFSGRPALALALALLLRVSRFTTRSSSSSSSSSRVLHPTAGEALTLAD